MIRNRVCGCLFQPHVMDADDDVGVQVPVLDALDQWGSSIDAKDAANTKLNETERLILDLTEKQKSLGSKAGADAGQVCVMMMHTTNQNPLGMRNMLRQHLIGRLDCLSDTGM